MSVQINMKGGSKYQIQRKMKVDGFTLLNLFYLSNKIYLVKNSGGGCFPITGLTSSSRKFKTSESGRVNYVKEWVKRQSTKKVKNIFFLMIHCNVRIRKESTDCSDKLAALFLQQYIHLIQVINSYRLSQLQVPRSRF